MSAGPERRSIFDPQDGDFPGPEWVAFGGPRKKRSLIFDYHQDAEHPDRFYLMDNLMTVFGFGRDATKRLLKETLCSFLIWLLESDAAPDIFAADKAWLTPAAPAGQAE
ncbi:MAG: hypothetical protein AAGI48_08940 [Verrucomicrobiota bacterium]